MNSTERRSKDIKLEKRSDENEQMVVEGYAVVFESPETYSGETEIMDRHCLDEADLTDVVLRYNHNDNQYTLARTRNKSLELTIDDKGLFFRAELIPTTTNKDAYLMVKEGLLDKCSFAFTIDEYEYDMDSSTTRITKIGRLFDVALVDFPYYNETSCEARDRMSYSKIHEEIQAEKKRRMVLKLKKEELLKKL